MNTNIIRRLIASFIIFCGVVINANSRSSVAEDCMLCDAPMVEISMVQSVTEDLNASSDNIIGNYLVEHKGEKSKVKVFKNADGTYTAQVFWVQNRTDKDGSVRKDAKNPNKSLRNVDCDKIVIFKGLKYNASSKTWSGTTIYDPVRGINASLTASFKDSKTLALKGSKMGLSETVFWTKL